MRSMSKKAMVGHRRNTAPMLATPRCGAKTRAGRPCVSPAVRGKRRCRMHGGAPGSGAPLGNKNALKTGRYTRKAKAEHKKILEILRHARELMEKVKRAATASN
jgi:hypothetical protein